MKSITSLALMCLIAIPPIVHADDAAVRTAIERSLPYLQADGARWMEERSCVTCHQVPVMVWSLNEAKRRGFTVSSELGTWNQWALANGLKKSTYFKITAKTLPDSGLPAEIVAKLKPLVDKNFVFEGEFLKSLEKTLGTEAYASHGVKLTKLAALPNQGGGGGGTNNQLTALLLSEAADSLPEGPAIRKDLVAGLVNSQAKDGSWPAANQFIAQQRPTADAVDSATRWTLFALLSVPEKSAAVAKAIENATAFLANPKPTENVDTLVVRALLAAKMNDSAKQTSLLKSILALQHSDGGWGWLTTRAESDPLTTGTVLYALTYLDSGEHAEAIEKAKKYLLATQNDKGIWPVSNILYSTSKKPSRKEGDYIYTYWATGWATLGLLQTLK